MLLENIKNNKDSPLNTAIVAGALCLVCALVVSTAASSLKAMQDANIALDRKKNLLAVTKFPAESMETSDLVNATFKENFDVVIIDMDTGEEASEECLAAMQSIGKSWEPEDETKEALLELLTNNYDQFLASKTKRKEVCTKIPNADDPAGVKYREKYSYVYILKDENGATKNYVLPVRGYGLWSMMHGYLAVKPDLQTVEGLVFYDQAETPGLGGEVKSERFKCQWPGKKLYSDDGEVKIRVIKNADTSDKHCIDALSGATITSNGVTNMTEYWLGPSGFGRYIEKQKSGGSSSVAVTTAPAEVAPVETITESPATLEPVLEGSH